MTLQALIFDVDGTLADTEEAHRVAFNRAFAENDLSWHWSRRVYAELLKVAGGKERLAFFIRSLNLSADETEELLSRIGALHIAKTRFYTTFLLKGGLPLRPGIARLLEDIRAHGLRLAIASTTTRSNVDGLIKASLGEAAFEWFEVIACGDQVARKKPAPDVYELALSGLQLAPTECVAVEDSGNGVRAAQDAGIFTLVSPTRWNTEDDTFAAEMHVASFDHADLLADITKRHSQWLMQQPEAA